MTVGKVLTYLPDVIKLAEIGHDVFVRWVAQRAKKHPDQLTEQELDAAFAALRDGTAHTDILLSAGGWTPPEDEDMA